MIAVLIIGIALVLLAIGLWLVRHRSGQPVYRAVVKAQVELAVHDIECRLQEAAVHRELAVNWRMIERLFDEEVSKYEPAE